jgi:DNA-binding transcriptional MerR regulator
MCEVITLYKVKDVAELAGVSVRTLHYYDQIGLLKPAAIGENQYRYYGEEDFSRLQQILFFKELDFSLQEIKGILDDPNFNHRLALVSHKRLLTEKKERLERIIQSIDRTVDEMEGGIKMSKKDMFEPFDMKKIEKHQKKYDQEVKNSYGNTKAYQESMQKMKSYKEDDWKRIHEKNENLYRRLIATMHKSPEDDEVQQIIHAFRQHITDNYYECTPEIFRGLGDMYVNDPRFTKNIDKYSKGLAAFKREAMHIYCDRLEGK